MLANVVNFGVANVSTGYDAAATSIALASGHGANLPPAPFIADWWNVTDYASPDLDPQREFILVGTRVGDALSNITRGYETALGGLAASTKNTGGKTYRLMATVTAGQLQARSVTLGAGGPTADVSSGIADWGNLLTVPADFLKAGDTLEFHCQFWHKSGAYAYAPRVGFDFGGQTILIQSGSYWSATEFSVTGHGWLYVQTAGAAAQCFRSCFTMRENGIAATPAGLDGRATLNTTTALSFVPNYRFDSGGETMNVGGWSVVLHRP